MKFSNLQKLAEQGGRTIIKDFDGIKNIVDDCLADLTEKIGPKGQLSELCKAAGVEKVDNAKDDDGATILERIAVRTAQYKKEIDALMLEMDVILSSAQVNEARSNRYIKKDALHVGFEDRLNFQKAKSELEKAKIKFSSEQNFGIFYINFENEADKAKAVKLIKKVIDKKLESEW
jgi:hypothetical protein